MGLLYFILTVVILFIILSFLFLLRVKLVFNTDSSEFCLSLFWIDPFIKAFITVENINPVLELYLFNRFVFKKSFKRGKRKSDGMKLIRIANPKEIHVNVQYGFQDPFATGITCGAISMASQLIPIDSIVQTPDFLSTNDYINLDATAKVNIGSTIIQFIKSRSSR